MNAQKLQEADAARAAETLTFGEGGARTDAPAEATRQGVAGRYVTIRQLGKGAFGTVFAAHDTELHRLVALKFIRSGLQGDRANEWRARLMREAKAMARVSHQNVVTLYDVGVSNEDGVFLAMELVEGGTLGDWLGSGTRSWKEIVLHLCAAGDGLAAAHRAGIIHRDFKLDNVLLGSDGRPRVTDFGIARSAESNVGDELLPAPDEPFPARVPSVLRGETLAKLTLTGAAMGTPGYMAPEQYASDVPIDARADVFAFCATLYRALYGERPFAGETFEQIAALTFAGAIRKPPKRTAVPAWVHKIVVSGLAADRNARPRSIDDVITALRADAGRAQRRWSFAVGAVLATAGIVGLGSRAFGARAARIEDGSNVAPARMLAGEDAPKTEAAPTPSPTVSESAAPAESAPERSAPAPQTQATPPLRAKARAPSPTASGARPAHATAASKCTVEVNYDAEGAPHFKRVCK